MRSIGFHSGQHLLIAKDRFTQPGREGPPKSLTITKMANPTKEN